MNLFPGDDCLIWLEIDSSLPEAEMIYVLELMYNLVLVAQVMLRDGEHDRLQGEVVSDVHEAQVSDREQVELPLLSEAQLCLRREQISLRYEQRLRRLGFLLVV